MPEDIGVPTTTLAINYLKAATYKEAACHGTIGGPTPGGKIFLALYAERGPVPRTVEYLVPVPEGAEAVAFNEAEATPSFIDGRQGFVRNLEAGFYLDVDMAERLADWLMIQVHKVREGSNGGN